MEEFLYMLGFCACWLMGLLTFVAVACVGEYRRFLESRQNDQDSQVIMAKLRDIEHEARSSRIALYRVEKIQQILLDGSSKENSPKDEDFRSLGIRNKNTK